MNRIRVEDNRRAGRMSSNPLDLVAMARGRLLVDETERQRLTERDYVFHIGLIARAVNIGALRLEDKSEFLIPELQMAQDNPLLYRIPAHDHMTDVCDFTLDSPVLGLRTVDGSLVMLDGRRRLARALVSGRPGLRMCVVSEADLLNEGWVGELKQDSTLLRTTSAYPAQRPNAERSSVAMIPVEIDPDRRRGAPLIDDIGEALKSHYMLAVIKAVEIQRFIEKNKVGSASSLAVVRDNPLYSREEIWVESWRKGAGGPTPPAVWNTVADQAARVIRKLAGFESRSAYRSFLRVYLSGLPHEETLRAHSEIKHQIIIISKAYLRYKLWNSIAVDLSALDDKTFSSSVIRDIRDVYNSESSHGDTELSFEDQAKLAQITEVNPTLIYKQYYRYLSFFEGLIYAKQVRSKSASTLPIWMIETYAHRRAMELLGQTDPFSQNWSHLFPLFHAAGLTDAQICQTLKDCDKEMIL